MTKKQVLKKVEEFSKKTMDKVQDNVHNWKHVDRVRKWALKIGKQEGSVNLFILEVTALLHDVGRLTETKKINHFLAGEKLAKNFLKTLNYFTSEEIEMMSRSVREHGPGGESKLTKIIQDADRIDMCGALGIMRNTINSANKPIYIDKNSFDMKMYSQKEINKIYKEQKNLKSIMDHFELSLSIFGKMNTKTAKNMARKKIKFMKDFIKLVKKDTVDLK